MPEEISRSLIAKGKHLELQEIKWKTASGRDHLWETAERVQGRGAVLIIPWLVPSRELVLIRQHRPPACGSVIEFPAGLIDEAETPDFAALRELREETGYVGSVQQITPPAFNSPGLSGETVNVVRVAIDETNPINSVAIPTPETEEHIEVLTVHEHDLTHFMQSEIDLGTMFDSKVISYIMGLTFNS